MQIETRTFGSIEIGESAPYIKQVIQVNGRPENCGLYIADEFSGHASHCLRIAEIVDDIDAIDAKARDILRQELQDENATVIGFLDFHLEEVEDEIRAKLQVSTIDRELLLQRLDLRTIGFTMRGEGIEFSLDYCPGEEFSDELLVVKFLANGDLIVVAHES